MSEIRAPAYLRWSRVAPTLTSAFRGSIISLSEGVARLALNASDPAEAESMSRLAPLPAEKCWIELPHPVGWIDGDGPEYRAYDIEAVVIYDGEVHFLTRFEYDEACAGRTWGLSFSLGAEPHPAWLGPSKTNPSREDMLLVSLRAFFVAICAILAAPGVSSKTVKCREKRLRQSRQETAPLVTYRCIDVDVDSSPQHEMTGEARPRSTGVALHHVRGHMRVIEPGFTVSVRAHWRGDARYGMRLRDRNIMRNEETH